MTRKGDSQWESERCDEQEARMDGFIDGLPDKARLAIVEIGAGMAVPTVRYTSETMYDM